MDDEPPRAQYLMLTYPKQYYAFLQALVKMPTNREGDCPGIAVWPLATGPDLPWKREEYANLKSKHAAFQHASYLYSSLGNALIRPLLPWPLRARASVVPPLSYFYRKN